jgi:hypothetical protein
LNTPLATTPPYQPHAEAPLSATTRYHRITSRTARRAGKSKIWLFGIAITQRSHILKIKIYSFAS